MNKNYIKSLINEMFDQNILNSEDDRAHVKNLISEVEEDLTGNFDEDLEYLIHLIGMWEGDAEGETEVLDEKSVEEEIEEEIAKLHVGFNVVDGIGAGYVRDEEDLENFKLFVRGALMARKIGAYIG